jgi:hypothetical protein
VGLAGHLQRLGGFPHRPVWNKSRIVAFALQVTAADAPGFFPIGGGGSRFLPGTFFVAGRLIIVVLSGLPGSVVGSKNGDDDAASPR